MIYRHEIALENPWKVGAMEFPKNATDREKLVFLLNYAVLAPSILNTQPWRFLVMADRVALYANTSRRLPVIDPEGRELTISCGAALLNLCMALRGFGYEPAVTLLPDASDPDRLAEVRMTEGQPSREDERRLCNAILNRRTNRVPFEKRIVPGALLDEIARAVEQEGGKLKTIDDMEGKRRVGALVAEAVRVHLADPAFRTELSDWVSGRISEAYERYSEDFRQAPGAPGLAGRTPPPVDERSLSVPSATAAAQMFADADRAAADTSARTEAAPVLALLTTQSDERTDWLVAGQALERALLVGTAAGLVASYDSPPLEIPELRARVAEAFAVRGRPQLLLRFGYSAQSLPLPRQPLRSVIM